MELQEMTLLFQKCFDWLDFESRNKYVFARHHSLQKVTQHLCWKIEFILVSLNFSFVCNSSKMVSQILVFEKTLHLRKFMILTSAMRYVR